ncbi:hypothetical protein C1J05_08555 [Sulfitobacter sp. JL08]|nr:hypothetical protein C1J05_08555 [Sulfitobacter sp. JL08]
MDKRPQVTLNGRRTIKEPIAMRHRRTSVFKRFAAAVLLICAAGMGHAGTPVVYSDGEQSLFRVDVPDFWSVRTGGERVIADPETDEPRTVGRVIGLAPVEGGGVWVGLVSPRNVTTLDQADQYLRDIGPFLVQDTEISKRTNRRIAGLPARTVAGRGTRDRKSIDFTAVTIDLPNGRVAVAVVVFEAGADPASADVINEMFASFKAIR